MIERDRPLSTQAILLAACLLAVPGRALPADPPAINWVGGVGNSLSQPASFYGSKEAIRIAETVLLYQRDNGGWPKNYDREKIVDERTREATLADKQKSDTTFDNGATHTELRLLA